MSTEILLGSYLIVGLLVGYKLAKSEMYKNFPDGKNTVYKRPEIGPTHRFMYAILIAFYWPIALFNYWVRVFKE
jgi:hypothetical protein